MSPLFLYNSPMERDINIDEISDGKKYHINDMVKIACNDCAGCSSCCENMDKLITLDPYDIHRMLEGLSDDTFETLINNRIELTVDRGIVIPTLMMNSESGKCTFLNGEGRCSIHSVRPGICRLFPMGRLYEEDSFYYFLQKDECNYSNKSKIKLKNWIDTKDINKYERFVFDWNKLLRDTRDLIGRIEEKEIKQIDMIILNLFYINTYNDEFYNQFYERFDKYREAVGI